MQQFPPPAVAPPGNARNPLLLPLVIVTSVLATLLLVAAGVAVVSRLTTLGRAGSGACVVGAWTATAVRMHVVESSGTGVVTLDYAASGVRLTLRGDGTGETDYGSGVEFVASGGVPVKQVITGKVTYGYLADGGHLVFRNVSSAATVTMVSAFGPAVSTNQPAIADPVGFTCAGDSMNVSNASYDMRLRRVNG